jgi:hypothetical protein
MTELHRTCVLLAVSTPLGLVTWFFLLGAVDLAALKGSWPGWFAAKAFALYCLVTLIMPVLATVMLIVDVIVALVRACIPLRGGKP